MKEIIAESLKFGLWRQFDIQFAYMLVKPYQDSLFLAVVTLSFYINRGHVCLPLIMLIPNQLFCGLNIPLATHICEKFGNLSINCWEALLFNSTIVSNGSLLTPLVLDKQKLYLYCMWKNECSVVNFFHIFSQKNLFPNKKQINQIIKLLDKFFPINNNYNNGHSCTNSKNINWQKIAIAMILTRQLVIVSGGPGTGKTSIIAKLLVIILLLNPRSNLTIKMAAPTGKSTARLNETVSVMIQMLCEINNGNYENNNSIQVLTLHRLLGLHFNQQNLKRAQNNFLSLDYLIIDESSMIDLSMMAKIVTMLSHKSRVIFLGDHRQLPSVNAGSVFSDICYFIGKGYTSKFSNKLKILTNYILPVTTKSSIHYINDSFCLLSKNYRFSSISGIGKLSNAIISKKYSLVISLLQSRINDDLEYITLQNCEDYYRMIINCALGYSNYFKDIVSNYSYKSLESILTIFNRYRILCVLREGMFGVKQLNFLIENVLHDHGFIVLKKNNKNYVGRPIIITSNEPSLPLFNGEIGVILPDDNDKNPLNLCAYFLSLDKCIKKFSLYKLPAHETSFVITIHKSQGSEFDRVALIFPNKITPILTNELFYTGVTRACKYLLIYATNQIIRYSVNNISQRYSGLVDKLKCL